MAAECLQCLLTAGVRSVHSSDLYNLISHPFVEFIALPTGSFLSLIHFPTAWRGSHHVGACREFHGNIPSM